MSKFIFDHLTDRPTVLASGRKNRGDQAGEDKKEENTSKEKVDFFAKGNEHMTPPQVYVDQDDWNVRVIPNKFPIIGDHEVIIHSPDPQKDLEELPQEQVVRYIRALLNRVAHYNSNHKEVFIFNNKGPRAGATVLHPHSQLVALKGFPGTIAQERESAMHYFNEHSSCFWCDLMEKEQAVEQSRIVYETKQFMVIVPEASRWSYEMKLMPKRHLPNFEFLNDMEINDLALVLRTCLKAYDDLFDKPDRNFWIHTQKHEPFHWHMGFIPHIKRLGGIELGAGIWVSDKSSPEEAAASLREVIKNGESVSSIA